MSSAEITAACGMALIIIGVLFFLARDMRRRVPKLERLMKFLERRTPYVPWFSPGCIITGMLLVVVGFLLAFL